MAVFERNTDLISGAARFRRPPPPPSQRAFGARYTQDKKSPVYRAPILPSLACGQNKTRPLYHLSSGPQPIKGATFAPSSEYSPQVENFQDDQSFRDWSLSCGRVSVCCVPRFPLPTRGFPPFKKATSPLLPRGYGRTFPAARVPSLRRNGT